MLLLTDADATGAHASSTGTSSTGTSSAGTDSLDTSSAHVSGVGTSGVGTSGVRTSSAHASGAGAGTDADGGGQKVVGDTVIGQELPACAVEEVVDATGAGDVLAGTATARLALGDDVTTAVRLGMAAAALSLRGRGGTGHLPPLDDTRRLAGVAE